jgi:hypothetical protein
VGFQSLSVQALASALSENKTLKLLNLESNYISGQGIINILAAINVHQVVTEFRVSNQVSSNSVVVIFAACCLHDVSCPAVEFPTAATEVFLFFCRSLQIKVLACIYNLTKVHG